MPGTSKSPAPRARNRRGEGDRLREDLISAASAILEELPTSAALSMRAVARGAGVSAPSVYLHFTDPSQLVLAVLERRFAELAEALEEASAEVTDARSALRARCLAYLRFAREHPGHYSVMFDAVPESDLTDESELPGAAIIGAITELVARSAPTGADPRMVALLLWCGLHGIARLQVTKPKIQWPQDTAMLDALLDRLLG